jgi:hypothetical protein
MKQHSKAILAFLSRRSMHARKFFDYAQFDENDPSNAQYPTNERGSAAYCQRVLANQHLTFICIDEFGFQIGTHWQFGRAPLWLPAQHITSLMKSVNVSVCLAASPAHGLIYHDCHSGAFDRETFSVFIDSLAEEVSVQQIPNPCFILDNCTIHNLYDVTEACETLGANLTYYHHIPRCSTRWRAVLVT